MYTRTWRWILNLSRMTYDRLSRISAKFPPVSRCSMTAVTKNLTSTSGTRVGQVYQSIANWHAEFLLFEKLAELSGDGFRYFVGDHFQGGGESVAGANGAGQRIDGFRKEFFEFFKAVDCVGRMHMHKEERADQDRDPATSTRS